MKSARINKTATQKLLFCGIIVSLQNCGHSSRDLYPSSFVWYSWFVLRSFFLISLLFPPLCARDIVYNLAERLSQCVRDTVYIWLGQSLCQIVHSVTHTLDSLSATLYTVSRTHRETVPVCA